MIKFYSPYKFKKEEVFPEFEDILGSGIYTNNGPKVRLLEKQLLDYSSGYVKVVSNGTIAIQLSLRALKITGDVITTPFSFVSSVSSILWENCNPIFADIDPETLCIDPKKIREKITSKTQAIMGVHMFGNICDVQAIEEIANEYNLKVIYDGAHAFGSRYKQKSIFQFGDCSTLSLHAYKILSASEGGVIFCKDKVVNNNVFEMRYFGKNIDNKDVQLGINAKMSEFHAALALISLKHAADEIAHRKEIASFYFDKLGNLPQLKFQKIQQEADSNCSFFPIILPDKHITNRMLNEAKNRGIEFRKYFHPSLNKLPYIIDSASCPVAEDLCDRVLCLPIGGHLSDDDLSLITNEVLSSL